MTQDQSVDAAVATIAEQLSEEFALPDWHISRTAPTEPGSNGVLTLVSRKYVGHDGSTPTDFSRAVQAAFHCVGAEAIGEPGVGEGGWLIGRARLGSATITVRSKGSIEISAS